MIKDQFGGFALLLYSNSFGKGVRKHWGHIDRLTAIYVESNIVNHDCLVYITQEKTISQ